VELLVGDAQEAAVDVAVVAAFLPRRRPAYAAGGLREPRYHARPDVLPELRILVLQQRIAGPELRVLEDVGDCVDRAADDTGLVEDAVDLGRVSLARPGADDPLQLLLVVAARAVSRKPGILCELGLSHRLA